MLCHRVFGLAVQVSQPADRAARCGKMFDIVEKRALDAEGKLE